MDNQPQITDRITDLKNALEQADKETQNTIRDMASDQNGAMFEDTEMGDMCPGWGEWSQWGQWFN